MAGQGIADPVGGLVVEESLPPMADDALGEEDDRDRRRILLGGHLEIPDQRLDEFAERLFDDHELDPRHLPLELLPQPCGRMEVVGDMDHDDLTSLPDGRIVYNS